MGKNEGLQEIKNGYEHVTSIRFLARAVTKSIFKHDDSWVGELTESEFAQLRMPLTGDTLVAELITQNDESKDFERMQWEAQSIFGFELV